MTNGTLGGVCVHPDQGDKEESPMAKSSSSTSSDKQGTVSNFDSKQIKLKKSKTPSVEVPKKKGCPTGMKAPKFNDQGACNRCKHSTITTESITCELCDVTFHACCREKNGNSSSSAICTPTFHEKLLPVMTKYGTANANRWGNIFFICNSCKNDFKSFKSSRSLHTCPSLSGKTASAKKSAEVGTVTDSCGITTDAEDNIGAHSSMIPVLSSIVTKNVETLFGSLQESLLSNLEQMMVDKIRPASPEAAPFTSSTFLRRGSSDSITSSDSCYSSLIGQPAPSMMSPPSVHPPISSVVSPSSDEVLVGSVPSKTYASFFTDPLHQVTKPNFNEQPAENSSKYPDVEMNGSSRDEGIKDHVIVLNSNENTNLEEAEKNVEQALKSVPMNFLRTNRKSKKIIISCPSDADKTKAKSLLAASEEVSSHKMTVQDARKMLPKVTVSNIPNSILSPLHKGRQNTSLVDYRIKAKDILTTKFLEKNHEIGELVLKNGDVFQIVFVNTGVESTSVGIKVSPTIRNILMKNERIYIGNTSCKVFDRFDIRQCFYCQQFGHISANCQFKLEGEDQVCMFCSASHPTKDCSFKHDKSKHRCVNCSHTDNYALKQNCHTHHSGSDLCPLIISEKANIRKRTQYSKNL